MKAVAFFLYALLGVSSALAAPGADGAAGAPGVAPAAEAETVGSLFREAAEPARASRPDASGMLLKLLGWVAALAVLALAAVRIWLRLAPRGLGALPGGTLRVVARSALSPRHLLYLVRVGNSRLLVVGVSGDRIAPLSEFDDPAQVLALDPTFQRALAREGGEGQAGAAETTPPEGEDLLPFRREVNRLREVVKGWKGRLVRNGEGEAAPR